MYSWVMLSEDCLMDNWNNWKFPEYRKGTIIRQAPVFRHLRALRKNPWKFIIWISEL